MKTIRIFFLSENFRFFGGKIFSIFESACFRNVMRHQTLAVRREEFFCAFQFCRIHTFICMSRYIHVHVLKKKLNIGKVLFLEGFARSSVAPK